ncbi:thiolase family protein [Geoalkalibacter sp.]|uniref:thiolase family protein n=1 Tax=Geoalkalibacter sp. TaxID=3041440 RepID=UPI00272E3E28|nr:thiolase family protein [Geoalkalibacter sp.]
MENVYVVEALRTPFGSFGGVLADVPAPKLAAPVIAALLQNSGVAADAVEQVIAGQVLSGGAGQAPARQAMRFAGLPDGIPALTINKVCGSGLKAMMLGADAIRLGDAGVVVAGGMENMSLAPYTLPAARFGLRMGTGQAVDLMIHDALTDPYSGRHMGEVAEARIAAHGLSREEQDAYAAESYIRAQKALAEGLFKAETVAVTKASRKGDVIVDTDEEPARGDVSKLAGLRPVFAKDGSITAGNASTINDGAAFALLAGESAVQRLGLKPKARLIAYATNSLHPDQFPDAPVGAIERACAKAGLKPADIDLWEINEAFAAVTLIAIKELGLDRERVNVNGGAVAIGHPVGASGARLVATLIAEMQRRQARYGLATLCIGGGEAVAAIFERV